MGFPVHLFEARRVQVGVNLGGGQVGVAQEQLQHPQIGAPGEEMGGEGMPQGMAGGRFIDASRRKSREVQQDEFYALCSLQGEFGFVGDSRLIAGPER